MPLKHSGNHENAVAFVPETLGTSANGGVLNGSSTSEEGRVFLKPPHTDLMNEIIDFDGTNTSSITPHSFCKWGSIPDESSFPQLDDLLHLDSWEAMVDSGVPVADRCFPPSCQSFPQSESVGAWAAELVPDFPCPLGTSHPMPEIDEEPVENVSDVFARWLQSNSHLFSFSDISRIKLKTSTVENGVKRLGGGKKGLLYFLKLFLSLIQSHHVDRKYGEITGLVGKIDDSSGKEVVRIPARVEDESTDTSQFVVAAVLGAGSDASVEEDLYHSSVRKKDECFDGLSHSDLSEPTACQHKPERIDDMEILGSAYKNCYSQYSQSTVPFQTNWNTSLQNSGSSQQQSTGSTLFYACNITPHSVAHSSLPVVTAVGSMDRQRHDNAAAGFSLQERIYLQPRVISSESGQYSSKCNAFNLHTPNRSAATTRAARMSRMERRKWSVQRNRKWPPQICRGALRLEFEGGRLHDF